ncbi:hypothetical protein M434DRAFT_234619 [Hypoxylon sp. CO27-5]|nr:hypothetical protein M434DRAFT_234619 [Hypoxylon sp. CO27-5]
MAFDRPPSPDDDDCLTDNFLIDTDDRITCCNCGTEDYFQFNGDPCSALCKHCGHLKCESCVNDGAGSVSGGGGFGIISYPIFRNRGSTTIFGDIGQKLLASVSKSDHGHRAQAQVSPYGSELFCVPWN